MHAAVAASSITVAMKVSPSLTARSAILRRHAFEALLPCVLAAAPLFWVIEGLRRSTLMPLGRDQGIFQYVGWALRQGERDYVHIRDVNGPLTHWLHAIFQALGGEDTRIFHVLDVTVSSIVFTSVGFLVAGTVRRRRPAELGAQLGWGLAAFVLLSAQYLSYGYWDQAQRESFFDWFMLLSVALQLSALASPTPGSQRWAMIFAGGLTVVPWFGKLTYGAFTLAQVMSLLVEDATRADKKRAVGHFAQGALLVALLGVIAIAATGSLSAYLRITFVDVPAMYRFIWPRTISDMLAVQPHAGFAAIAFASSGLVLALVGTGQLARRFVVVGLLPLAGLASALVQRKGFLYHFHPVTAAVAFQWLVVAHWGWNAVRSVPPRVRFLRAVPLGLAAVLSVHVAKALHDSPHVQKTWLDTTNAAYRNSKEYLTAFPESDYFGWDVWRAADFLKVATRAGERVQMYGMDPYVLFLARRLSATPYIYGYDLNADAALAGGAGAMPSEKNRARITLMMEDHRRDFDARLRRNPPAAFVFLDKSPLLTGENALADFETHAKATAAWFRSEYIWARSFDTAQVWLRRDLVTRVPLERQPL